MRKIGFQRPGLPNNVNFPLCLAPMVGLSHVAFRELLAEYLPEGAVTIWPTEMLNSRRVPAENLAKTPESLRREDETFWMPQILGNEEDPIRNSVKKLLDWGANGIDINMGCPVKKALKHNYGVALMGDTDYAGEVVRMTKQHCSGPVSVKLRAGKQTDPNQLIKFVTTLEASGADWLTIHPRDPEQQRRGKAYWPQIKLMRDQIKIPVIGNGDVQTVEDVLEMLNQAECDMVMAGRALTARPWMMWQLGERLGWPNPKGRAGVAPKTDQEEALEWYHFLRKLSERMEFYFPLGVGMRKYQFFIRTSSPWLQYGNFFYGKITACKDFGEVRNCLDKFFSQPQFMLERTTLAQ